MQRYATIVSTGRYLPEREISNDVLRDQLAHVPDFVDKMEAGTGIRRRWYAPEDWAASDLALRACQCALAKANCDPSEVDLILLGTDTPDYLTPATSVVLQDKLGAKRAGTFDIGCACASFPTGLATAAGLIATNRAINKVLVTGVYLMHKFADPADPMIFFYGDGAGAALLQASEEPGYVGASFLADGSYADCWGIFSSGSKEPPTHEAIDAGRTKVRMLRRYPPEINDEGWPRLVRQVAADAGFAIADIDHLIFTQVRKPTIELVMNSLGLPLDRTTMVMEDWGYTGSACVGMALDRAMELGRIAKGALVVLVGSGVGYNQCAAAFRMPG